MVLDSRRASAFVAILAALLVAGCSSATTLKTQATVPKANFTGTNGGVEGIVTDDEARPVAGVIMQLLGTNRTTNTTQDGHFAISDLAPADYLLILKAPGYLERKYGFEIPSANITHVKIVMTPIPPPTPFTDSSYTYPGYFRYSYAYRVATVEGNSSGLSTTAYPDNVRTYNSDKIVPRSNWGSILFEAQWDSPADELALKATFPLKLSGGAYSSANSFWLASGKSPLRWRMDRPQFEELRNTTLKGLDFSSFLGLPWTMYPSTEKTQPYDAGVITELRYTVFVTIGYNGPLDANYTRLPH